MNDTIRITGPFIGHTTTTSTKIWIYAESFQTLFLAIYQDNTKIQSAEFDLSREISADCVEINNLQPNQKYYYRIFTDENNNHPLLLDSLNNDDLYFYTMPDEVPKGYRYDFLVMSCHNPREAETRGYKNNAWNVWQVLPQIIEETTQNTNYSINRVLFALLIGDQVYADEIEQDVLNEKDETKRIKKYIDLYIRFWDNPSYRKVLCSLPAYLMWDDHDITDGWGSREDSYVGDSSQFSENWHNLFSSAKKSFSFMQANRNPNVLTPDGFDFAFKIGRAGFVVADLRSNRNVHAKTTWLDSQFQAVKDWIDTHRSDLDILFFISTVVFAHGAPQIEEGVILHWPRYIQNFFDRIWEIQNKFGFFRKMITNYISIILFTLFFLLFPPITSVFLVLFICFFFYIKPSFLVSYFFANLIPPSLVNYYYNSIGDLRDDINDSWYSDPNKARAEELLTYFFDLQNDKNENNQLYVSILTGDIHTAGYSNIYSNREAHQLRPIIHHLVASPVAYPPFSWVGEAFYRKYTSGAVTLGTSQSFQAQIAHHFTERNALICSLRDYGDRSLQLIAKFYLEGFPEPQINIFDLEKCSHKEDIKWKH